MLNNPLATGEVPADEYGNKEDMVDGGPDGPDRCALRDDALTVECESREIVEAETRWEEFTARAHA